MKLSNADMPAMPVIDEDGVLDCDRYKEFAMNPTIAKGLTKRETIAKDMDVSSFEFLSMEVLESFIGCKVDQSNIISVVESQAKANAKLKVMFADALLAELDKTKGDAK